MFNINEKFKKQTLKIGIGLLFLFLIGMVILENLNQVESLNIGHVVKKGIANTISHTQFPIMKYVDSAEETSKESLGMLGSVFSKYPLFKYIQVGTSFAYSDEDYIT